MEKLIRNIIAWFQEFWPMWQLKIHLTRNGEAKEFEMYNGKDWWLPRVKRRVNKFNEPIQAIVGKSEIFAYYERIR